MNIANYKTTKQIYESANSLVYRGVREKDNQPVILKVLKEDYPTPEELTRYRQEYDITRRLDDIDGVIKAYHLDKYQNTLVMILEDFGGESLKHWLAERSFTLDELLKLATTATDILGQIHEKNIIHKDINTTNLAFNPGTGVLKFIDFGISTQLSKQHLTLKNPDVLEGTLAYLSPEQTGRMNRTLDYRTDFYSLGVTFYEFFTGKLSFESADAMELVHCHIAKQPTPPHQINPDLPETISHIILKLLEKTAEARYQSAWGIKADLEECKLQFAKTGKITRFTLAQQDISDRFQVPQKLYGREPEIETLLASFERVTSGKAEMMLVAGYSGIGKSVLVKEIYKSLGEKQGYFITGKFDQFQRNIPYSAIVNAFGELTRQLLSESKKQLESWRTKIVNVVQNIGQVIIDVIPEVALIIGEQPPVPHLPSAESQIRFNTLFQKFMGVFINQAHPLVIFLDDLQWADLASLQLIELLMTDSTSEGLLMLGAYRDNEVSPTHPLMTTLTDIQQSGRPINTVNLKPLKLSHVIELTADTLHCDLSQADPLATLIMSKTNGNPFFLTQLLNTLHDNNLIRFDFNKAAWQWDMAKISTLDITDNVVELMLDKLNKFDESTQTVLRLAACLGNQFDLDLLALVHEKSQLETAKNLWQALQNELILPLNDSYKMFEDKSFQAFAHGEHQSEIPRYKFLHDRVQQAAYSLIPDDEKPKTHLKIGRLLWHNVSAEVLEEDLFNTVNHLNVAKDLITDINERLDLVKLNLRAGLKAKDSSAHEPALAYFTKGIDLMPEEAWQAHYDLTFKLYQERSQSEYLCGHFETAETLFDYVLNQAKNIFDKCKIYNIRLALYDNTGKYLENIAIATEALKNFDIILPVQTEERLEAFQKELAIYQTHLETLEILELVNAPEMTDINIETAMQLLMNLTGPAYFTDQNLLAFAVLKMVNLSIEYGNSRISPHGYAFWGLLAGAILGAYQDGFDFGRLAINLNEKWQNFAMECKVFNLFSGLTAPWRQHMRKNIPLLKRGFKAGVETGDVYTSYIAYHMILQRIIMGDKLEDVLDESQKYSDFLRQMKNYVFVGVQETYQHVILNLLGKTHDKLSLSDDNYDEKACYDMFHDNLFFPGNAMYNIFKLQILYLYGDYKGALAIAPTSESFVVFVTAIPNQAEHYFFYALTLAAIYSSANDEDKTKYWEKLEECQAKIKIWADNAPENFMHKYLLIEAEKARIQEHGMAALDNYDQAIAFAHENDFIPVEALANELAAKFWLEKNKPKLAKPYLQEAHYFYQQWGATAKVDDLEEKYPPFFLKTISHPTQTINASILATTRMAPTSTKTTSSNWLDLNSVMKASQTLSGEIVLRQLLEKMMHLVIENAGAEKGFLLLPQQDNWFIEAQGQADRSETTVLQSLVLEESDQVSANIIHYVARTQDNVVLHDATQEGSFTRDAYIVKHRPKSLLCMPLVNQGQLTGILYLENNLTTDAFTANRLETLNMLSSQIAISIENSLLYNNLEENVVERTQELSDTLAHLKATQAQLVESEKMASLGGLVAGVAHEINTPIGIGLMSASTLIKKTEVAINAFKSNQLKKSTMGAYFDQVNHGSQLILRNLERASELVKSFKQVAVDQSNLEKRSFMVKKYLEEMLVALKPKLQKTPHQITLNGDEQIKINSYPGAFSQVVTNLLMNSITHAYQEEDKGHLRFDIRGELEQVIIEYSDDGCGIPTEHLPKIFDPFFTTGRVKGGTGLGLHITYNLVTQKLKGTIQVESVAGVGTTFIINLPLVQ